MHLGGTGFSVDEGKQTGFINMMIHVLRGVLYHVYDLRLIGDHYWRDARCLYQSAAVEIWSKRMLNWWKSIVSLAQNPIVQTFVAFNVFILVCFDNFIWAQCSQPRLYAKSNK